MKKAYKCLAYATLALFLGTMVYAQEKQAEKATVAFSNPSKAGFLEVSVHNGGITIKGYNGKEVIIEAKVREKKIGAESRREAFGELAAEIADRVSRKVRNYMGDQKKKEAEKQRRKEGMKLIKPFASTGLSVEEENNHMEVSVDSLRKTIDLVIQVPYSTSLELNSQNYGDIVVENVKGDIEVNNHNGALKLSAISGSVVANTYNGAVEVTFAQVDPKKPMSFSTWNGDVDITFPANLKANLKMKSERGDIYSDFDVKMKQAPVTTEKDSRKEGGKYRISFDRSIYGSIGGGGQEYLLKTYNGDIYIRKAK